MATDTSSLTTPPVIQPVDFAQLLATLTAQTLNKGQDTTTPANAAVQPVAAVPAASTQNGGPVVNPLASMPTPPPQLPAGNTIHHASTAAPLGDTSFTSRIAQQGQVLPMTPAPAPVKLNDVIGNIDAGTDKPDKAIDAVAHLAGKGEGILKLIAEL